ncbi:MAG TPA: AAA family ATPase [Gemmatimonadales bacterium]|nr:AAA family ATPase [Gemmatimonadales bacterium]
MPGATRLEAGSLSRRYDAEALPFRTTDEVPEAEEILGQPRAVQAIEFGMGMPSPGYGMFAFGARGTGKHTAVLRAVRKQAEGRPVPPDRCYVHNFDDPRRPTLIELPAGTGAALRSDMERLVDDLRTAIPAALESEEFQRRRQAVEDEYKEKPAKELAGVADRARPEGLGLLTTPSGFAVVPIRGEEVLSSDEFGNLPEPERERLQARMAAYQEEIAEALRHLPRWSRERREHLRQLAADAAGAAIEHIMDELRRKYESLPKIVGHLDAIRRDVIEHLQDFTRAEAPLPEIFLESLQHPFDGRRSLRRYGVNLLVDNSGVRGAPVVEEDNPSYESLCGRVEHLVQFGALVTDLGLIRPGSLHRAHGGYLVLEARKVLQAPFAWEALKRALKSGQVRIESPVELLSLGRTVTLEPEPAGLDLKVVLLGPPSLYYLLSALDPDFDELFKVTADFTDRMPATAENIDRYVRLIATLARREQLPPLDRSAVGRLLEESARLAGHKDKLCIRFTPLLDLLREAGYWARRAGAAVVGAAHVDRALEARIFRTDRPREQILEEIAQGTLLIDTAGARVGQVNGLSTVWLGDFCFARPSRITARVRLGQGNVVDIEREVELGGPIHSKGVLILAGYLGAHYASEYPLSLAASLVFEQSYADVEGDSASAAELVALLSALSGVPLQQSIAVTGSVNQHGAIQAVGAINEKVEGFFEACRLTGLTGQQGVVIPAANVRHLVVRREVVEAVAAGKFHVYPVETVDQALELLTGLPAGQRDPSGEFPEGSVNQLVASRLRDFAETWRQFNSPAINAADAVAGRAPSGLFLPE